MKSVIFTVIIIVSFVFVGNSQTQDYSYPSELKGFEFLRSEKIKDLQLAVSSENDVLRIFGKDCAILCDYKKDWRIYFTYFHNISKEITFDGKKTKYIADSKYTDKLYSIKLIPKERVSLNNIRFSETFEKSSGISFGHDFSGKSNSTSTDSYTNPNGVRYVIFKLENYTTFSEMDNRRNGDLISIEYFIPNNQEEKMFIEQK